MNNFSSLGTAKEKAESNDDVSWWSNIVDPTKLFPNLPPAIAIVSYCCIIVGIVLGVIVSMWVCSTLTVRRAKRRRHIGNYSAVKEAKKRKGPWSLTMERSKAEKSEIPKHNDSSAQKGSDTLKHLDRMPWWDYVSNHPYVDWYNYYRMAEGRNRPRAGERKNYPWQMRGYGAGSGRKYHFRAESDHVRRLLPEDKNMDMSWERVQARPVDSRYWNSTPVDTSHFPRFRMIPRATWTDPRLMSWTGTEYGEDYGNQSMASMKSTDMHIMQMVARRHQHVRPLKGDVLYRRHINMSPRGVASNARNFRCYSSPYDFHNANVSLQHSRGNSRHTDISRIYGEGNRDNGESQVLSNLDPTLLNIPRPTTPPPPSPPGYPPPPTPLNATLDGRREQRNVA